MWTLFWASQAMAGATVEVGPKTSLTLGLLLQPRVDVEQLVDDAEGDWSADLYLRRARLMAWGTVEGRVNFFVETDNPKLGLDGDWSGRTYIQDAWMEVVLSEALQVDAGLLLVPFTHHGMQGATSLQGLDYHGSLIRYPSDSSLVWRDGGVMARGLLGGGRVEYRLSVTEGAGSEAVADDPTSQVATLARPEVPRVTGRLTVNAFDPEGGAGAGGFFYDGQYLEKRAGKRVSPKKVLSAGLSIDRQPDAAVEEGRLADYQALGADLFADLPLGDGTRSFGGQVNVAWYDRGEAHPSSGLAVLVEAGYRQGMVEPVASVTVFDSAVDDYDLREVLGGLDLWFDGHRANLKVQGGTRQVAQGEPVATLAAQSQLCF